MTSSVVERPVTTAAAAPITPLLFVVWIETNCGYGPEPDWEMDWALGSGRGLEPLPIALDHAAVCRAEGYPTLIMLPGQTPRADGLFSNPAYQ